MMINDLLLKVKQIPIEKLANDLMLNLDDNYQGNCPTGHPSKSGTCFKLNLKDNLYHCFNCGIGGDVISLHQLVTGDDFRTTVAELSRIYLGYKVSYNSYKNTRGRKQIDSDINYELNEYLNQKYFLKLEKDYFQLQWEVEMKNLTYQKKKLDDLFKMGKIEPVDYYTKLELLYNTMNKKFAEIDERYMAESYRIRNELRTLRKMKNEQFKNGFRARRRREISRGSKKENTLR